MISRKPGLKWYNTTWTRVVTQYVNLYPLCWGTLIAEPCLTNPILTINTPAYHTVIACIHFPWIHFDLSNSRSWDQSMMTTALTTWVITTAVTTVTDHKVVYNQYVRGCFILKTGNLQVTGLINQRECYSRYLLYFLISVIGYIICSLLSILERETSKNCIKVKKQEKSKKQKWSKTEKIKVKTA